MTCRIFISQLMKDKTNEEIKNEREKIKKWAEGYVKHKFPNEDIQFLDSFMPDLEVPEDVNTAVYYMSKSIEVLSHADFVVFAKDWAQGRGTVLEHDICSLYNISYVDLEGDI